jgi:hypothetical protein
MTLLQQRYVATPLHQELAQARPLPRTRDLLGVLLVALELVLGCCQLIVLIAAGLDSPCRFSGCGGSGFPSFSVAFEVVVTAGVHSAGVSSAASPRTELEPAVGAHLGPGFVSAVGWVMWGCGVVACVCWPASECGDQLISRATDA